MKEKMNYAWPVTSENAVVYHAFLERIERYRELLHDCQRIVIFGAGIRGCCLLKLLEKENLPDIVFADNNPEKQGNLIYGYDILPLEEALEYDGRKIILIAPENGESMAKQLEEAGLREREDWISFSVSAYDAYLAEYRRQMEAGYLLVMGDCAFTHVALSDRNFDSLGAMIKAAAGEKRSKVLDMHGMGQQAYYHISRSLLEGGKKPAAFLLLLMIETMAPKVPIMPRTQHPELIRSIVRSLEHPDPEFSAYAELTRKRFERFQVEAFASFDDKTSQQSEKLYMEVNYLFRYRDTTEGVTYLKKSLRMMNEAGIPVVLYVPPVNFYQGEKLFGKEFKERYEKNFKELYRSLDREGLDYEVVDASYLLDLEDFAAENTIDETCKYSGREKILRYLKNSAHLRPFLERA